MPPRSTNRIGRSQAQRQKNVRLDDIGIDQSEAEVVQFDALADTLLGLAIEWKGLSELKLRNADKIASGGLANSINPTDVVIFGNVYSISIEIAEFYKFVDEGVKGWRDKKGGASPYQFKNTPPGKAMVTAIRKWLIREGLKGRGKENSKKVGIRDTRRKKITDTSTNTAYAISAAVKRDGIAPSYFWRDTVTEMRPRIKDELGKVLKVDIIEKITS